jgi:hypothetical protein
MFQNFGSSEGCDTTGSCCHYTWNDTQGHGQLPREATSVYHIQGRHLIDVLFKTRLCKTAFCCWFKTEFGVLSRNKKHFAVSSLVFNLLASQIQDLFLPHPVLPTVDCRHSLARVRVNESGGLKFKRETPSRHRQSQLYFYFLFYFYIRWNCRSQ